MNPCIDCSLDKLGCHEKALNGRSFADERCDLWFDWQTELHLYRPDLFFKPQKPQGYELMKQARQGED